METMTKEEAMKYCRYYGKVDMGKAPEGLIIRYAKIEEIWAKNVSNKDCYDLFIQRSVDIYTGLGLESFSANDGVPYPLKHTYICI